ncbi:MAG: hypothetical protein ACXV2F_07080 [Halobacteriota archaeon]
MQIECADELSVPLKLLPVEAGSPSGHAGLVLSQLKEHPLTASDITTFMHCCELRHSISSGEKLK